MQTNLSEKELEQLIISVFSPSNSDHNLGIIVDLPDNADQDNDLWRKRRLMAADWAKKLNQVKDKIGLDSINLIVYKNVRNNNADLPDLFFQSPEDLSNLYAESLNSLKEKISSDEFFSQNQLIIAPTEFSATAPLKLNAKKYNFRAVTMPGFSENMIPALKLNYQEINSMVNKVKTMLDKSTGLEISFTVDKEKTYKVFFDLRFRTAHASGGRFPEPGHAGNLPSGEAYIVPYEGEGKEESKSSGIVPVQFDNEVVLYRIDRNRAVEVLSSGQFSDEERGKIKSEPAYSNIAELGFGVLKKYGLKPVGQILLDEKLGLHIAFGRSDHFGGMIGVKDFSSPDKVVHIDRIYTPELQSRINVDYVTLFYDNSTQEKIMENGEYLIL